MNSKKKILIAPLDWGLGHATRCIPIAKALMACNYEVIFACDGRPLKLLKNEFPDNDFIKLAGYDISYPKNGNMTWSMMWQSFKILRKIKAENKAIKSLIQDFKIDGIISDNRYGLRHADIPSVFITHQLNIQSNYFQSTIQNINFKFIKKFDECWIADSEFNRLSADLSTINKPAFPIKFTGLLSRFKKLSKTEEIEVLAIVSGPEPQRTLFENILFEQLTDSNRKATLVLGKPELNKTQQCGNLKVISHLNAESLNQEMSNANLVISRSGYSTIMDVAILNKKAIFIPTPGQTEQLYLATHFDKQKIAFAEHQHNFNLEKAIEKMPEYSGFDNNAEENDWQSLFKIFEA